MKFFIILGIILLILPIGLYIDEYGEIADLEGVFDLLGEYWFIFIGSIISFVIGSKKKKTKSSPSGDSGTFLICPYFSEKLNMCIKTDDSPTVNQSNKYCTSSNCINCPNYD